MTIFFSDLDIYFLKALIGVGAARHHKLRVTGTRRKDRIEGAPLYNYASPRGPEIISGCLFLIYFFFFEETPIETMYKS